MLATYIVQQDKAGKSCGAVACMILMIINAAKLMGIDMTEFVHYFYLGFFSDLTAEDACWGSPHTLPNLPSGPLCGHDAAGIQNFLLKSSGRRKRAGRRNNFACTLKRHQPELVTAQKYQNFTFATFTGTAALPSLFCPAFYNFELPMKQKHNENAK